MIYSMTGYAALSREFPGGAVAIELRSVNHRYLDIGFRMPDELRPFEPPLRELIAARVNRGKIECRIALAEPSGNVRSLRLNEDLLRQVLALAGTVRTHAPDAHGLSVADLLRWPGMLDSGDSSADALRECCASLLADTIEEFMASRAREGEKLKALLLERAARMEALVAEVLPRLPQILESYREKLGARLRDAIGATDDDRVRQELALFATKIDVDEEIGRLMTHLAEMRRILAGGGAVGKRLDFMMQEFNREANTLGSKSVDVAVTRVSMELKVLIEQMREQIQNIE